ncbi:MAG TPA: quinone-dependent dihydroorotate dehydrogenase [Verrucomicrobiae bacterium]|nr:quinone-dependent dihydroorotate dehydrogenase [Verrucomicrobiae bacterium]
MIFQALIRPILFRLEPEVVHNRALQLAETLGHSRIAREALETLFCVEDRRLQQTVFGIDFLNPVGLAAGFDKNAVALPLWPSLGFGFLEIGSVTTRAQGGNPTPRLFRLENQRALINHMGFNNDGADAIAGRLSSRIPVGVNVGKHRDVELRDAASDYAETIAKFRGRADFFVLNVSSPNTPGLRKLQEREMLDELLTTVTGGRASRRAETDGGSAEASPSKRSPVVLKLSPDLNFDQLDDALELARRHGIAGIVATNTTTNHPTPPEGGLSGAPLRERATECIRHIWRQTDGMLPIVGVGGIFTAGDAYVKIRAGASLVEVWTALVYEGPGIVRNINRGLLRLLERDGFGSIAEAVGTE